MRDRTSDHGWRRHGLLYPMLLVAAIAVIILSVLGIAVMTGWLRSASSSIRVGDEIEHSMNTMRTDEVKVKMSDNTYRTLFRSAPPVVRVGARVRASSGRMVPE